MKHKPFGDEALEKLQRETFDYFLKETHPRNGLVPDSTRAGTPSSIAAIGLALASYAVGVERGFITRDNARQRTLTTLRFLWESPHGEEGDATGYKGFYYHFLDMQSGRRAWKCELSTIDTTFLIAGALTAATYFDRDEKEEREIRELAERALPPHRLAVGAERRANRYTRLEARERLSPVPVARLQRSAASLRPRSGIADSSAAPE